MPRFSIIAVDYEYHVPRPGMHHGLQSLLDQTFDDYELIIVHDGPKGIPYEEECDLTRFKHPVKILNTPERMNDWGHSGRDLGMRHATGDYFLHFNIDNKLYPECLQRISDKIDETGSPVVIFSILHFKAAGGNKFTGVPPRVCHIDALQLVASREVWENVGYWYTKEGISDGIIYEEIGNRFPWVSIDEVLAENY